VAAAFRRSEETKPTFLAIVKAGFKAERIDDDVSVARDNQILTDEEVDAILQAACEVDQELGFDAIYIGSSYVWPRPARGMPRSGECAWATYRFLHGAIPLSGRVPRPSC
jgi:hypothetical protein